MCINPLPIDRLRCCHRLLAVKPLQCAQIEQAGLSVYPYPTVLHTPLDGWLFTLAWLAKQTGRRRVRTAAVRRTQSNRTRRSAARLAIATEFSVAADAASQNCAKCNFGLSYLKIQKWYRCIILAVMSISQSKCQCR